MIIDTHCHLHDEKFAADLNDVLMRARDAQVSGFVTIGCDIITTTKAKNLAELHDSVYFTAGFHPHEAKFLDDENLDELKLLAQHKKCVGIGECGLDFYYYHSSADEQRQALIQQINLAQELKLPLIIHLRDAFKECLDIFETYLSDQQKVLIHCFSGTLEEAHIFCDMGFYLSLSGIVTFKKPGDLPRVAKEVPLERLVIETDSPYLAPLPYRGKRNEPSYIRHTLQAVADARGQDVSQVENALYKNSKEFFQIP